MVLNMINPKDDGITHINVYSKGQTELGKLLSNWGNTPFVHYEYGKFKTVEGCWYWLITGNEKLRDFHGYQAKQYGKELEQIRSNPTKEELISIYQAKLYYNSFLIEELKKNKLPFKHYYVYENKVVEPKEWKWTIDYWTLLSFFLLLNPNSQLYEYTQHLLDFKYKEKLIEIGMPENQECNSLECWVIINSKKFLYSQTVKDVIEYLLGFKL